MIKLLKKTIEITFFIMAIHLSIAFATESIEHSETLNSSTPNSLSKFQQFELDRETMILAIGDFFPDKTLSPKEKFYSEYSKEIFDNESYGLPGKIFLNVDHINQINKILHTIEETQRFLDIYKLLFNSLARNILKVDDCIGNSTILFDEKTRIIHEVCLNLKESTNFKEVNLRKIVGKKEDKLIFEENFKYKKVLKFLKDYKVYLKNVDSSLPFNPLVPFEPFNLYLIKTGQDDSYRLKICRRSNTKEVKRLYNDVIENILEIFKGSIDTIETSDARKQAARINRKIKNLKSIIEELKEKRDVAAKLQIEQLQNLINS